MSNSYFFDTYALIEIIKGNLDYKKYSAGIKIVLNKLNLLELYYFLIREKKETEAKETFNNLLKFHVEMTDQVYLEAARMKHQYKKDKLSYIDCLGYCMAKHLKIKFLTGDQKFKDLPYVEFVK